MKLKTKTQICVSLLLTFSLLLVPVTALAKKGEKNFKRGMQHEAAQQWEKAAQEFTLAVAADPANMEYQLHFRRASFNASQSFMQQGRALAEQRDFIGAYNAFRQAYGYDPVNELAVSEMERMLRLQSVKEGTSTGTGLRTGESGEGVAVPASGQPQEAAPLPPARSEQLRVITYNGDLKAFVRSLAEQLQLNVVFDRTSFAQPRTIDINLRDVTTAQALDYIFLQEGLFFQKLSRRTILVADQARRPQYQQLVLRTFFLSNMKPSDARQLIQQAIPPSVGRPQTIVVPDDATNSLTVRDTAENVRLIGDLLASIDKDRAEVVMDVNIYEVTKSDLLQFGNQIGNDTSLTSLGGIRSSAATFGGLSQVIEAGKTATSLPVSFGAALIIPSSAISALQAKNRTRLIASTQVHAFNGEESTARIGQRVPVQTAQTYPFGVQTGQPAQGTNFPTGGFPVINYEPTGLTLKFTPQVFPNLDVQVKMSIESKDVLGASTLTPTFTERTITGTARVQNNRTMMLASVAQTIQSNGRRGLPLLGLIPILGRLFSTPTRDNRHVDIVIAVTPRVLRAPTVTPRDEEMRPSGTLQSPTTGSLEAMIIESDREDQLAAARKLPRNAVVNLPDVEPAPFSPAARTNEVALNRQPAAALPVTTNALPDTSSTVAQKQTVTSPTQLSTTTTQPAPSQVAEVQKPIEELPAFVPAPKSLVSDRSAEQLALVNTGVGGTQNAVLSNLPKPIETAVTSSRTGSRTAQLSLTSGDMPLKVGEKRQLAIELKSDAPLGLVLLTLRFDPKVVKVTAINPGTLLPAGNSTGLTQSIDPKGIYTISISTFNGAAPLQGGGSLVFIEVQAIAEGEAGFNFDRETLRLIGTDTRDVVVEPLAGRVIVKQ